MEASLRKEAWKFLLGYVQFGMTTEAREKHMAEKRREYEGYKCQWQSITPEQLTHFAKMRDRQSRVGTPSKRTKAHVFLYSG